MIRYSMSASHELDPDTGLLDVEETRGEQIVLGGEGRDPGPFPPGTFRKIGSGMATLVLLIVATYLVPGLQWARPWTSDDPVLFWNVIGREILGEGAQEEQQAEELARAEAIARAAAVEDVDTPFEDREVVSPPIEDADAGVSRPAYRPHPDDAEDVPQSLELADAEALDRFFEQLARTEAGYEGAITRVTHWGDSVIANDNVTSTLRAKMQRRFGDAGHGFHLLAKPNNNYRHLGILFSDGTAWSRCYIINKCKSDGRYGLGGTTVWSTGGAQSRFRTATKTPFGQKASRFELWYAQHAKGGRIRITVDGGEPILVDTALPENAPDDVELLDAWHVVELEDGPHTIDVRAAGGGLVRAYGVVLERDRPGVVWDGMEQLGAFASRMLYFDEAHLHGQIERRDTDLLVFMFGGNDLQLGERRLGEYEQTLTRVLRRFRPEDDARACLVVSPVDHGYRDGGRIAGNPMVPKLTEVQRSVALAQGCAFFDTYAAMGGEGAVGRWRRARPPLISGDLAHLTQEGQKVLGHYIYLALMEAYREYRARTDAG
jgi:lysophospholipase L1-like esterase